jgi:purine-binding chemotaxis protein CheW
VSAGDCVIVSLGGQGFGIPVAHIRDVLRRQPTTPMPLAPRAIAGLINLRGRIVTAIDLRARLGLPAREDAADATDVVVEHSGELYALIVDAVGDVVSIADEKRERVPLRLDPAWRALATAVYPSERGLIVLLNVARLLDLAPKQRAAS